VFTPQQHRAKAAEYTALAKQANARDDEGREERSLTMLADNEHWLADNHDKLANNLEERVAVPTRSRASAATLAAAEEEEHILRCLGTALTMQWNMLPPALQRVLFDDAGSMGELADKPALRGQIARFLRRRTDGDNEIRITSVRS
jgi:hypothetical protein